MLLGADRHPLDPSIGADYSKCRGPRGDRQHCTIDHCHCDYHDGLHGCDWGNKEFVRRLTEGWHENRMQLNARKTAHALGTTALEDLHEMTIEDFYALPHREEAFKGGEDRIHSFVVLPAPLGEDLHDSGYRRMGFVAVTWDGPMYRFGGGSDNISFDGIGGDKGDFTKSQDTTWRNSGWQCDCLPGSGLLHFWCRENGEIGIGKHILSTFEPLARRKEPK